MTWLELPGINDYAFPTVSYPAQAGIYAEATVPSVANIHWAYAAPPVPAIEYCIPPSPRAMYHHPMPATSRKPSSAVHQRQNHRRDPSPEEYGLYESLHTNASYGHVSPGATLDMQSAIDSRLHSGTAAGNGNISEKNQLNVGAIEQGKDMRTTVMVKNIPNKMSDKDLLAFINKNGCNVGYAFVNFITVGDLLHFAKTQLGVKWNMYSSEKVLQMCYATYQGKEALVEKFKNSCIMDERESWRPKIFYSDGPDQGLPEPFPAPTHLRRKERSSHNRGALFVPGPNYQRREASESPSLFHRRPHPPRMSAR
ncbi:predicted protein [Postia placenta Mad-698-R]|nr:predicted protein [Postia placenta Mad-698-R]